MPYLDYEIINRGEDRSYNGDWECWGELTASLQDYGVGDDFHIKYFEADECFGWTPEETLVSVRKVLQKSPLEVAFDGHSSLSCHDTGIEGLMTLWVVRDVLYSEFQIKADNLKDLFLDYKQRNTNVHYTPDCLIQAWTSFKNVEQVYNGTLPVSQHIDLGGGELFNYMMGNIKRATSYPSFSYSMLPARMRHQNEAEYTKHLIEGGAWAKHYYGPGITRKATYISPDGEITYHESIPTNWSTFE